jgi:uncharacterized SAM-binding protein YcdF (DUF218 family)
VSDELWSNTVPESAAGRPDGSAWSDAASGPDVTAEPAPPHDRTPVGGVPIVVRPRRRRWRRLVRVVVAVGVLVVGYLGITIWQVHSTGQSDEARPVDAIVVMGAAQYDGRPSPQLQARLDHAIGLWRYGVAPIVVVTGGKQPLDRFTEAEASAAYLVDQGVPLSAIVLEGVGSTSYDSLAATAVLLRERGASSVLLVSDPFHALRIRLTAEELGLEAFVSPTRTSPVRGTEAVVREMKEAAGVALGRIIGFRRLLSITG